MGGECRCVGWNPKICCGGPLPLLQQRSELETPRYKTNPQVVKGMCSSSSSGRRYQHTVKRITAHCSGECGVREGVYKQAVNCYYGQKAISRHALPFRDSRLELSWFGQSRCAPSSLKQPSFLAKCFRLLFASTSSSRLCNYSVCPRTRALCKRSPSCDMRRVPDLQHEI